MIFEKLSVLSQQHGKTEFVLNHSTREDGQVTSLKASSPGGALSYRETICESCKIWESSGLFNDESALQFSRNEPYFGLAFNLTNNIRYIIEGLHAGTMQNDHFNLFYLPTLHCELSLRKNTNYCAFGIHFFNGYLSNWKDSFPLLTNFMDQAEQKLPSMMGKKHIAISPVIKSVIQNILDCQLAGSLRRKFLTAKVDELLILVLPDIISVSRVERIVLHNEDIRRIEEVHNLILQDLAMKHSIPQLAHHAGVNEFKLKIGFKQLYHNSIARFRALQRMSKARRLLLETSTPVNEIAMNVGYPSLSNFSAAFKSQFGYPPTRLRKEI